MDGGEGSVGTRKIEDMFVLSLVRLGILGDCLFTWTERAERATLLILIQRLERFLFPSISLIYRSPEVSHQSVSSQ
jgi:hypothetical protein